MQPFDKIFIAILFLAISSCQKNHVRISSDEMIVSLLDSAGNDLLSAGESLRYAFKADSLSLKLKNDSLHLRSTKTIAMLYLKTGNNGLARDYYERTATLAEKLSDTEKIAVALSNIARILNDASEYDSAQKYFSRANQMFRLRRDSLRLAQGLLNEGIAHKTAGQFRKAFQATMEAVHILESSKKLKDLASAYTNLGNILKDLNRLDEALDYHQKALTLRSAENDSAAMAGSFNNIGNIYRNKKDYRLALSNYFQAKTIKEKSGISKTLATTYNNIATVYLEMHNYPDAEIFFAKALHIQKSLDDKDGFLNSSNRLARLYLERNESGKAQAIALATLNLSNESAFLKQRLETTAILFETAKRKGNYKEATRLAEDIMSRKDSLFNKDMAGAVSQMEAQYKTQQALKELSLSQALQKTQLLQIRNYTLMLILLSAVLLLLAVIVFLLYRSNKFRKQAKERVELLMQELNHRVKNNLQMITGLFNFQMAANSNPQVQNALSAALKRIESIGMLHRLLHQSEYTGTVSAREFLGSLLSNLESLTGSSGIQYQLVSEIEEIQVNIDKAISMGIITNELLTNIFKYAKPVTGNNLIVTVSFYKKNKDCLLIIKDNSGNWNSDAASGQNSGTGLFLVDTLVAQMKGTWEIQNSSNGTQHVIQFK